MTSILDATLASSIDLPTDELPTCVRCKEDITSGHAYELGDDKWHTHCFSCYRCNKPLSCESDFLVLGTGTLICFDCSDSCKNCGKKIDDLAIILSSSNEAYCSDCFKCCKCGEKIKDLRYAKTKRGLFCLSCHERLLAKRKYHEEKKRRLKKHLPVLPNSPNSLNLALSQRSPRSPRSHEELVIPQRSLNRPVSPPRNDFHNNITDNILKRDTSLNDILGATLNTNDNNDNIYDSSIDNLSLEPLENLENEGIIDPTITELKEISTPSLPPPALPKHNNNHKGGLYAEALNSPVSIVTGSLDGLGISSSSTPFDKRSSRSSSPPKSLPPKPPSQSKHEIDSIIHNGSTPLDGALTSANERITSPRIEKLKDFHHRGSPRGKSDGSMYSQEGEEHLTHGMASSKARSHTKVQSNIESVQVYKTPAFDFSTSSTDLRRDLLPTDLEQYNEYNDETNIIHSRTILKDLENDIKKLQSIKNELLDEITSIKTDKDSMLKEMEILKNEKRSLVNSSKPSIRNIADIQRPLQPPPKQVSNFYDDGLPIKQQEHVASIARHAKPKFWKFFSSSTSPPKNFSLPKSSSSHGITSIVNSATFEINDPSNNALDKLKPFANQILTKSGSFPNVSLENISDGSILYGSALVQRCNYEQLQIPRIIANCMENIECDEENLKSEGLYRKSGSQSVIEQLEKKFAKEESVNLAEYDINVSTSILKRYLRKLPDPLITYHIYEPLISLVRTTNMPAQFPLGISKELTESDMAPLVNIMMELPVEHINLLKAISAHLEKVTDYKEWNLMGLKNLALVFAPGLIRDITGEKDILDMKEKNYIIGFIFENYKSLFK